MDFSGYKIYIPKEKRAGFLIAPSEQPISWKEELIFDFDIGIKKLQEEKRAIYLTDELSNKEVSKYFEDIYGIFAA